jgi:hypothetical protein
MKLTNEERRFVEHWREEKSGPRWKFYALFTMAWSIVSFLVIFFLTKLFTQLWENGGANLIYVLIAVAVISGLASTHFSYRLNEKKYRKILGKMKEDAGN